MAVGRAPLRHNQAHPQGARGYPPRDAAFVDEDMGHGAGGRYSSGGRYVEAGRYEGGGRYDANSRASAGGLYDRRRQHDEFVRDDVPWNYEGDMQADRGGGYDHGPRYGHGSHHDGSFNGNRHGNNGYVDPGGDYDADVMSMGAHGLPEQPASWGAAPGPGSRQSQAADLGYSGYQGQGATAYASMPVASGALSRHEFVEQPEQSGMMQSHDPRHGHHRTGARGAGGAAVDDWGEGGLADAFQPRRPAPTSYAARGEASHMDGRGAALGGEPHSQPADDWEDGLESAVPSRAPVRGNIARRALDYSAAAEVGDGMLEGGGGFDERGRASRDTRERETQDASWGGMSLGDALAPKRRGAGPKRYAQGADDDPQHAGFENGEPTPAQSSRGQASEAHTEDAWGGQSLADAFAPKKKAPVSPLGRGSSVSGRGNASRGGGSKAGRGDGESTCTKTVVEIVTWVRSLPESHVPEKMRENLAAIIESKNLSGDAFTDYVQQVPPEVCAPKNAMKLKAGWNNVLREDAVREAAKQTLADSKIQKATMLVV